MHAGIQATLPPAVDEPGPYIQTVSGRRVNPFDPDPREIDVHDIAVALSNQCRFGGHTRRFYSVAQHACLTSDLVLEAGGSAEAALWGLLHDAAEAYLVDLPHPLKHRSELGQLYQAAEERLEQVLRARFELADSAPPGLKEIDRSLLATERAALTMVAWHWPELEGFEPLELEIDPWLPEQAAAAFLERYARLDAARRA
jgi:5'-deoxynucleotidase YfbR-like HD superfamily hydrolase